ncbi:MAG: beta strand repeat-containing protein [Anaerolineales bacterium]
MTEERPNQRRANLFIVVLVMPVLLCILIYIGAQLGILYSTSNELEANMALVEMVDYSPWEAEVFGRLDPELATLLAIEEGGALPPEVGLILTASPRPDADVPATLSALETVVANFSATRNAGLAETDDIAALISPTATTVQSATPTTAQNATLTATQSPTSLPSATPTDEPPTATATDVLPTSTPTLLPNPTATDTPVPPAQPTDTPVPPAEPTDTAVPPPVPNAPPAPVDPGPPPSQSITVVDANLSLTQTDDADPVLVGDTVTYTLAVANNGPDDATGVNVTIAFSGAAVTPQGISSSQGTCTGLTCNLGTLAATGAATVTVSVRAEAAGTITSTSSVSASEDDSAPADNSAGATTLVNNPSPSNPDVSVSTNAGATILEGQASDTSITVQNTGAVPLTDVRVNVTIPPGIVITGSNAGGNQAWANPVAIFAALNPGESATLILYTEADVGAGGAAYLIDLALIGSTPADINDTNDTAQRVITVTAPTPDIDLGVTLSASDGGLSGGTFITGGVNFFTYTLEVTNNGSQTATNIILQHTHNLSGVTNFSTTSPRYNTTTGVWNVTDLLPGEGTSITVQVNSPFTTDPQISSTLSITSFDQTDSNPVNNSDTSIINFQVNNLSLGFSMFSETAVEGGTFERRIFVNNYRAFPLEDVVVSYPVPAGLTVQNIVAESGSTYNPTTGVWDVGTIPAATIEFAAPTQIGLTVTYLAGPGTAGTPITHNAEVTSVTPTDPLASDTLTFTTNIQGAESDLSLTSNTVSASPIGLGEFTTVDLDFVNNGPSSAPNMRVEFPTVAGLTVSSHNCNSLALNAGVYTCIRFPGAVSNGSSGVISITYEGVTPGTETIFYRLLSDAVDGNPSDNTQTIALDVQGADVDVLAAVDNATPLVGEEIEYTFSVENIGNSPATNVQVQINIPAQVGSIGPPNLSAGSYNGAIWDLGSTLSGGAQSLRLTGRVIDDNGGNPITATASLIAINETDSDPTNDSGSVDIVASLPPVDLQISDLVANPPNTDLVNNSTTLDIEIRNTSALTVADVEVIDLVPPGFEFVAATESDGNVDGGTGTWTVPSLGPGATAIAALTIRLTDTNLAGTTLDYTPRVDSPFINDPNPGNNERTVSIPILGADLAVSITESADPVTVGESLTYTITVDNLGPDTATGATLNWTRGGAAATVTNVNPTNAVCTGNSCTLGSVPSGASATVVISLMADAIGTIVLDAVVGFAAGDTNTANNATTESTIIQAASADVALSGLTVSASPININQVTVVSMNYGNNGPDTATNLSIVFPIFLVSELPLLSHDCSVLVVSGSNYVCTPPSNSGTITFTYEGNAAGIYDITYTIQSGTDDPDGGNNTQTAIIEVLPTVNPPPVASFSYTPDPVIAGQAVTFTDTSTNSPTGWAWDFGDGNTSTEQNPTHTYASDGPYTVTLTASNAGGSNPTTVGITVNPPPPVASFTVPQTTVVEGTTLAFTNTSTGQVDSYFWDFGDGTTSTLENPTHVFWLADGDTQQVQLTVTNVSGSNIFEITILVVGG